VQAIARFHPCVLVLLGQGLAVVKRNDEKRPWVDGGWRTRYVSPSLTNKAVAEEIAHEAGVPFFDGWGAFVDGRDGC
jgi:hypothetical protein